MRSATVQLLLPPITIPAAVDPLGHLQQVAARLRSFSTFVTNGVGHVEPYPHIAREPILAFARTELSVGARKLEAATRVVAGTRQIGDDRGPPLDALAATLAHRAAEVTMLSVTAMNVISPPPDLIVTLATLSQALAVDLLVVEELVLPLAYHSLSSYERAILRQRLTKLERRKVSSPRHLSS